MGKRGPKPGTKRLNPIQCEDIVCMYLGTKVPVGRNLKGNFSAIGRYKGWDADKVTRHYNRGIENRKLGSGFEP